MPDENRFAGLGDQLDSEDEDDSETVSDDAADGVGEETGSTETGDGAGSDGGAEGGADDGEAAEPVSAAPSAADRGGSPTGNPEAGSEPTSSADGRAESGPAFAFDDTRAKSLYVRPETVELLEDAEFEVESILRRDHGIRDLTGREFHDALVRAVAADPEAVAELVADARDE
ncbi:hypothetical protein SAMN04487949_3550 [Halogranum gelatinilyticum]|uniref:Uncharacterized protein n=1 Tax=Halogranum gelatinilyticum TaxID=660521 RepID=A0A1G9Z9M9_9EURY|nr:hypothetical protein [Halogranum gelatinilyticum]SDN17521.1 hypothetical protein SAMN04487949_3550 [Halogranum gelatinilyticum]